MLRCGATERHGLALLYDMAMVKILLIDDHAVFRDLLEIVLQQKGYTVLAAGNGEDGLNLFQSEQPDLVLLDRNLPGITGSDVLLGIRKLSRMAKVIILTSHDGKLSDRYAELGVSAFLSKKDTPLADLLVIVDKILRKERSPTREAT